MAPQTSPADVVAIFCIALVAGVGNWIIGFMSRRSTKDIEQLLGEINRDLPPQDVNCIASFFDQSLLGFSLCTIPFVGCATGATVTSLMRDHGYIISPLLLLIGPGMLWILLLICSRKRKCVLERLVQRQIENDADDSNGGQLCGPVDYSENPFLPPRR